MDVVEEFVSHHHLKSRWLEAIIAVLLDRPNGMAHVNYIARTIWSKSFRDINTIEETVTRQINDYCLDAKDFSKSPDHDLFERVAPATYRLRSFPEKPDIRELFGIAFEDANMQTTWELFKSKAQKHPKWAKTTNAEKLRAFVQNMKPGSALLAYYEGSPPQSN